jgi:hypothetical protein
MGFVWGAAFGPVTLSIGSWSPLVHLLTFAIEGQSITLVLFIMLQACDAILSTAMHKFVPGFRYLVILSRSAAKAKNPVFALQERDSSAFGLRMTNAILGMNLRIGVLRPHRFGETSRWSAYRRALGQTGRLYVLIIVILLVGAIYEAFGLVYVVRLHELIP